MNKISKRVLKRKHRKSLRKRGGATSSSSKSAHGAASSSPKSAHGYDAFEMLRILYPDENPIPAKVKFLSKQLSPTIISEYEQKFKKIKMKKSILITFLEDHEIRIP